jgi:hypothetical protein
MSINFELRRVSQLLNLHAHNCCVHLCYKIHGKNNSLGETGLCFSSSITAAVTFTYLWETLTLRALVTPEFDATIS